MKRNLNWLDRIMLAVTLAEGNCPEEAGRVLADSDRGCRCGCGKKEDEVGGGLRPTRMEVNHCH